MSSSMAMGNDVFGDMEMGVLPSGMMYERVPGPPGANSNSQEARERMEKQLRDDAERKRRREEELMGERTPSLPSGMMYERESRPRERIGNLPSADYYHSSGGGYSGGMIDNLWNHVGLDSYGQRFWQFPRFSSELAEGAIDYDGNPSMMLGEGPMTMDNATLMAAMEREQARDMMGRRQYNGQALMLDQGVYSYPQRCPYAQGQGQGRQHRGGASYQLPFNPDRPNPSPLAARFEQCLNQQSLEAKYAIVFNQHAPDFNLHCANAEEGGADYQFVFQTPFQFNRHELALLRQFSPDAAEQITFYLPPAAVHHPASLKPLLAYARIQASNGVTLWSHAPYLIKRLANQQTVMLA